MPEEAIALILAASIKVIVLARCDFGVTDNNEPEEEEEAEDGEVGSLEGEGDGDGDGDGSGLLPTGPQIVARRASAAAPVKFEYLPSFLKIFIKQVLQYKSLLIHAIRDKLNVDLHSKHLKHEL